MAITATGAGNWTSTTADAPWPGGTVPGELDDVSLGAYTVVWDVGITTITINSLTATSGQLTIALDNAAFHTADPTTTRGATLNCPTLTAGTVSLLVVNGNTAHSIGVNGNITGGSAANAFGISLAAAGVLYHTGNVTGGSAAGTVGLRSGSSGAVTVANCTIKGGSSSTAYGIQNASTGTVTMLNSGTGCNMENTAQCVAYAGTPPTWNIKTTNTIIWGATTWYNDIPERANVRDNDNVAGLVGTMVTQTPDPATVSQLAGYYAAFNLTTVDADLVAANIKSGVTVFGLAGESAGGGAVVGPFEVGPFR
jgi:hypothetical protein